MAPVSVSTGARIVACPNSEAPGSPQRLGLGAGSGAGGSGADAGPCRVPRCGARGRVRRAGSASSSWSDETVPEPGWGAGSICNPSPPRFCLLTLPFLNVGLPVLFQILKIAKLECRRSLHFGYSQVAHAVNCSMSESKQAPSAVNYKISGLFISRFQLFMWWKQNAVNNGMSTC